MTTAEAIAVLKDVITAATCVYDFSTAEEQRAYEAIGCLESALEDEEETLP